jgi:NADH-quinone oxidoreductase subunit J
MLLDTRPEQSKPFPRMTLIAATLGGTLLVVGVLSLNQRAALSAGGASVTGPTLKNYAEQLFTTYLLPVQLVGFLLLIAMLGVIVLSKKSDQAEETP